MFNMFFLLCFCCCGLIGVFSLHANVTEIQGDDEILWNFGEEKILVAEINRQNHKRFRDRLKLNDQTGSLTITNTTTEDAGDYEVQISGVKLSSKTFRVLIYPRLPLPVIISNYSQCSSSHQNCSVVCSVVNVSHVTLSWLKGNSLLSSISVSDLSISLSLPLEVEDQDTNNYSCVLNNSITHQTTHLDISGVCHTCEEVTDQRLPLFHIVLISAAAGSLMILAAVMMSCICKKCRKTEQVKTDEYEITYTDPKFYKRKGPKSNVKNEEHVEYVPVAMRR